MESFRASQMFKDINSSIFNIESTEIQSMVDTITDNIAYDILPEAKSIVLKEEISKYFVHLYLSEIHNNGFESEVKEETFIKQLEEIRKDQLGQELLDRVVQPQQIAAIQGAYVSIYNGEKGHGVCNNERIWRVLRKKKDGKCIYRIVIKKGARANRIAHGKHRKCVMYIDRYTSVDSMPVE
jgi:hypothetical protein